MASGWTTTDALADSLPTVIASARIIREYEGVVPQLCDRQTLPEGVGPDWNEISLAQLTAQRITETTELDNPQQLSDTLLSVTPEMIAVETFITDKVAARIDKKSFAKTGGLAQNAVERLKDEDGIDQFDSGTSLGGAGTTLTSGIIGAGVEQIQGNTTEAGRPPFRCVLHPYQIHDIEDELVAGVGTYPIAEGLTARVFAEGFRGLVNGAQLYPDGNITIDGSTDDAKGGVFAQEGLILVQGRGPRAVTVRNEKRGGGGTHVYHYDEYAYGLRSSGNWLFEVYSDATAPTG
jgi:hypothetical protein